MGAKKVKSAAVGAKKDDEVQISGEVGAKKDEEEPSAEVRAKKDEEVQITAEVGAKNDTPAPKRRRWAAKRRESAEVGAKKDGEVQISAEVGAKKDDGAQISAEMGFLHLKLVKAHEVGKWAVHLCGDGGAKNRAQLCEFWAEENEKSIFDAIEKEVSSAIDALAKGYTEVRKIPATILQEVRSVARNSRQ